MKIKVLAAAVSAVALLGAAGSASAVEVLNNGYKLDDTSFGAQFGVHFDNSSNDVLSAIATVNQDNSHVTFSSTDTFDTDTGGEAVVADGSGGNQDPFNNLKLVFEHGWQKVTFSFDGGNHSAMTLAVNGGAATFVGGGNCSFCFIENGQAKFTVYAAPNTQITQLQFNFNPDVGSGRQFRVMNVSNAIPEPATWAMMIMGFGGVGALARRRRMALAAI